MMFVLDKTLYFTGLLFGIIANIMSSQVYDYRSLLFCRNQKCFSSREMFTFTNLLVVILITMDLLQLSRLCLHCFICFKASNRKIQVIDIDWIY